MLRREGRHAACDPYGQRPTTAGRQCGAENLVADTPKALTHELQLISTSRFAHLCRSRPRGSIRERVVTSKQAKMLTCEAQPVVLLKHVFEFADRSFETAH